MKSFDLDKTYSDKKGNPIRFWGPDGPTGHLYPVHICPTCTQENKYVPGMMTAIDLKDGKCPKCGWQKND